MSKEIILCKDCEGKGYKISEELEDYHKCEYSYTKYKCGVCKGQGRLTKTTTITFEPYKEEDV